MLTSCPVTHRTLMYSVRKLFIHSFIHREPHSWKEICDVEMLIYFHVLLLRVHFPENTEAIVNVMFDFLSGDRRRTKIY